MHVGILVLAPGALQFQVEAIRIDLHPRREAAGRLLLPAGNQGVADIAVAAPGQGDHARVALGQPGSLHLGDAQVLAFQVGAGDQPGQAAVALHIRRQQGEQGRRLTVSLPHHQVGAKDGLHAGADRRLVEFHQPVEIAQVGDRHRGHAQFGDTVDHGPDAHQAVDQRILGVQAQVDEVRHQASATPAAVTSSRTGAKLRR